jgi:hypothetical protein
VGLAEAGGVVGARVAPESISLNSRDSLSSRHQLRYDDARISVGVFSFRLLCVFSSWVRSLLKFWEFSRRFNGVELNVWNRFNRAN